MSKAIVLLLTFMAYIAFCLLVGVGYVTWVQSHNLNTLLEEIAGFYSIVLAASGFNLLIILTYLSYRLSYNFSTEGLCFSLIIFAFHYVCIAFMHYGLWIHSAMFLLELFCCVSLIAYFEKKRKSLVKRSSNSNLKSL